ncbi:MAG: FHA domain-containing protein [Chloroflexi bacterium]|nr:FHA domain-containing protein [Chloroflexota bacterium]
MRAGLVGLVAAATMLCASPGAFAAGDAPISVSSISASFFPNPNDSGAFTATPSTAVTFTQDFPALNFNTPADTVKCNPSAGVSPSTQPFTDLIPQPDGSCTTIVAQGNKAQAAVGDMRNFQAVFTGAFQVSAAGRLTFNVYSDDGWILSIGPSASGAQPGYVSGPMLNFPRVGPFTGYPIVGSYNVASAPNQNNLVVGFPSAGTYPFELDYSDCCEGTQALTVLANGAPIPPSSGLAFDVQGISDAASVQGVQHITVATTAGQPQQVEFLVDGKSQGVKTAAPFAFDWDTSAAGAGAHTLVFRATDTGGSAVDKQLAVQVAATSSGPTPVPTGITVASGSSNLGAGLRPQVPPFVLIGAGILGLLVLASAGVYVFFAVRDRQPEKARVPVPVVAEVVPAVEEKTEFIGRVPLENLTMVSSRRVQVLPKACLLVKPDREIELSRFKETVIGRDASNAAYVDDRQVSRHHARILAVDGDFWIEDLNSTNGTRVNGATVTKQKLANNDLINIGDTTMTFALEQA